ncbi:phenylacetate--CoA ligase family protein [Heliophilum fasciatum]|uniref:Phenylacetate-CoA ligase n=1 Tax=Heliophilum fasciatum TaxID=35700 RepID=A0A4R2S8H3_9FIRM|nr:phenylacetate--CoA ligase [Heliophilum fasciatum]MCW2276818.1 phenylacetate-CoA ligase [Heliophilum fasciatum]TCP68721.1 phenylacetate-CoA ligase [Heliophilum fasciatum]
MTEKRYWNEKVETLPRHELEAYQLQQLREHVAWAYEHSPYYRQSFDAAGVGPDTLESLDDLRKFPFVNKQTERERQAAVPLLGDMVAVPEEDVVFVSASSGSTGMATLSPFTAGDFDDFQDAEARLFWAAGMRPRDRYVHALNFTLFVGGPDVIGAQRLGALCIWAGAIPSERLLHILKEMQPTVTWTTPSYAWFLGETAKKHGIDPATDLAIRKIIVAGEPGGSIPATRQAIEKLWNAELYDFYGISDIFGACAGMCAVREGLHIVEDQILMEVLDLNTQQPVKPGEAGELVLTTLRKKARPMIRFRTGDIVKEFPELCPCGRTHKRFEVLGRVDDMFIVSGVNIFPSDIEYVVRNLPGLNGEYRITLYRENHLTKFEIEVEKDDLSASETELADQLSHRIKSRLGVRPAHVKVLPENTLPRATHKAKRVVDQREEQATG